MSELQKRPGRRTGGGIGAVAEACRTDRIDAVLNESTWC